MVITIVGTGYVGLVTGTCFSEMGNEVTCVDIDEDRIEKLKKGIVPFYEYGLEELIKNNFSEGRLKFSCDLGTSIADSLFVFIAVGTPSDKDGHADLKYVVAVAEEIGKNINGYKIIVNKSTVPVGTADLVRKTIEKELSKRNVSIEFDVVSNPEFLKEGNAVEDFMKPDRVVIGSDSEKARELMEELYSSFFRQNPRFVFMDIKSAEVTKYAANTMLATKISFINEIANLCEVVGADIEKVRMGICSDQRIGYSFLYPGIGYGGSCFPKDIKALIKTAKENDYNMHLLESVESVNNTQKKRIYEKIKSYYKGKGTDLKNRKIGIWGIAFKPETDDVREAPSLEIIEALLKDGAEVHVHDPRAMDEAKKIFGSRISYYDNNYDALSGCDAFVLLTEWHLYRQPNFDRIKTLLKEPVVFDGRNQYSPRLLNKMGFVYFGMGRS